MKNLEDFYETYITEMGRRPGSKNKPKEEPFPSDPNKLDKDPRVADATTVKQVDKQDVKKNGVADSSDRVVDVKRPHPEWAKELASFSAKELDRNAKAVAKRFARKHDFFVQGEAGWAKTSVIEAMAAKYGYNIITVYLDKAEATDLGGMPVATVDKSGRPYMNYSLPSWVLEMVEHPNEKYCIFFDEMNQAQPDVLNALMPIVLRHVACSIEFPNMIIGAAGNLQSENELSEISKPLNDRLKPIISWQVHTKDTWKAAFDWLHSKYDKVYGEKLISKLEDMQDYWKSPRDVERVILQYIIGDAERGNDDFDDPEDIREDLMACVWDEVNVDNRAFTDAMDELSDYISNYLKSADDGDEEDEEEMSMDNLDEKTKHAIIDALVDGYFCPSEEDGGDGTTQYLCTLENVISDPHGLFNPAELHINKEVISQLVKQIEADGKEVKYKTLEEGKKELKKTGFTLA